jgi:demethylmenaquinone methyltransferase/2-methoxy-6-polyprenyl-1,4-benzoquinol methylase
MPPDISQYEPGVLRVLQSKAETRAFYDKIAPVYDLLAEQSEQPMRDAGLKMLDAVSGERVLEIGFGTGHCVAELARAVAPAGKVYGIDLSGEMCRRAKRLLARRDLDGGVELTCADAEQLPYAASSLDAVFMSFVLELFDTPGIPRVLAECRRVLVPGGRLVVVAVSKQAKPGIVIKAFEWTHRHFPNLVDCRPIFVQAAMEAAGFTIKESEIRHMWVPVEIVLGIKET